MQTQIPQNNPQYIPESLHYKRTKKTYQGYSTTIKTKSMANAIKTKNNRPLITKMINHRLYEKYASSQNYYYMKDINAILGNQRIPSVIAFRDYEDYMKKDEVLRRFYYTEEYDSKLQQLTEYYKFHKEIPRIFSKNEYDIYFDYHDRKRKVDFVKITNMLKKENGEDPFLDQKLEILRKRQKDFTPILQNLSSYIRSSFRNSTPREQKTRKFFEKGLRILDQSNTINDIFEKLNDIVSLSSKVSFENSSEISLDNLTEKSINQRENIGRSNPKGRSNKSKIHKEMDMETSLLFKKTSNKSSERTRSKIASDIVNEKFIKYQNKGKKENFFGNFMKKKKQGVIKSEIDQTDNSKSKIKPKRKKSKKSEIFKKYSEKILKTTEDEPKASKLGKFNWTKLNKNFGNMKKNNSKILKKKKKESISGKYDSTKPSKKKPMSNRNNSNKTFKSSFATSRHKRESSLEKFREELSKFKFSKMGNNSQKTLKSSRSKKTAIKTKGHYKTKSEFGVASIAYLTRVESTNTHISSNFKGGKKSLGNKLDLDLITKEKKNNFFSKKKIENKSISGKPNTTDNKMNKFQFDNIYKTKFSNLKEEMKIFKTQRKSKPITFSSGGNKVEIENGKLSSKRTKKYLAKKNQHRVESLKDMKFLKKSSEKYKVDTSNLLSTKILNRSKEPLLGKKGKHKHSRSEPEKLLMHNFIKKNENEVNFKALGGFKNLVDIGRNKDFRRESQPFNSYRGKRRGNSGGSTAFGQILYSSRNV